jgi:ankyrin repeat protein
LQWLRCWCRGEQRAREGAMASSQPSHGACREGHASVAACLDKGADIEAALTDGTTPLMIACDRGTLQWLRCWCREGQRGADGAQL